MSNQEWLVVGLAGAGTIFMLISAIGIVRMPDVFARMQAVGIGATIGITFLLLAPGVYFGWGEIWRMMALVILFFVTGPVATTAITRAAYVRSPRTHVGLTIDDMADPRYRRLTPGEVEKIN